MGKIRVLYETVYDEMCSYLKKYYLASEELSQTLFECCTLQHFEKGDLLVSEGTECNYLYLIIRGFCSCCYVKDGKEYVLRFIGEGNFALLFHGFLGKKKAVLNIKAMEDTTVLSLSRKDFEVLSKQNTDFVLLFYHVLKDFLIGYEDWDFRLRSNSAEERVVYSQNIHEIQPLLQRVPQYRIASYLGMTPETFAKILGRLNKKTKTL